MKPAEIVLLPATHESVACFHVKDELVPKFLRHLETKGIEVPEPPQRQDSPEMPYVKVNVKEGISEKRLQQALEDFNTKPQAHESLPGRIKSRGGTIHVTRVVSAIAGGRVINPKTARSQIIGGVVWGIGQALREEAAVDHNFGRFMNHNYAEYHIPVNADIHEIEVIFVEEEDEVVNPLGAKGLGEIGIVGVAAAIGSAVYHATGRRVRDLPITLDKVLPGENRA